MINGLVTKNNKYLVKRTPGTKDGTTATDYNFAGENYSDFNITAPTEEGAYTQIMNIRIGTGIFPGIMTGASATTYYCDRCWFRNSVLGAARVGGTYNIGAAAGVFSFLLLHQINIANAIAGVCLSYK